MINERSKKMRRAGSVESILYDDFLKREQRLEVKRAEIFLEKNVGLQEKFSIEKSDEFMGSKINRELQENIQALNIDDSNIEFN